MNFGLLAFQLWMLFLVSWWLAAFWVSRGKASAARRQRAAWNIAWGVGFGLLFSAWSSAFGESDLPVAMLPLWRNPATMAGLLLVLQLSGFAFAGWARLQMGRLWSGSIVVRDDHRVIDSGPFRLVRHPIYAGYILAAWAFGLIIAAPTSLAGAAWLTGLMILKSRAEEHFLRQELGEAAYDAYAARTPQIVPVIGWR